MNFQIEVKSPKLTNIKDIHNRKIRTNYRTRVIATREYYSFHVIFGLIFTK